MKSIARFVSVLALLAGGGALLAQDTQIVGRVFDPARAAVGAARASITRVDSGERREAVSTGEGYFTFPLVRPGIYELVVQKEGFKSHTVKDVKVETGQVTSIEVPLTLGEISQSVDVAAEIPLLQTESAAVSHVVTNETISKLPLLDRRSVQLMRLNGFVTQINSGSGVSFSIAGGRVASSNYFVDGSTVQNVTIGDQGIYFDPPVEAMQEFNVNISSYSAELGRSGGAVVQMTTKSGTNQFHGSAYEYFRNDALNSNTYFARIKPILRYNLFGSSIGGPIRRNKTWFFFNYEGRRQKQADTKNLTLPTPLEARGDFSRSTAIVRDPVTNVPFPTNVIPPTRLDPVGVKIASFYPAPNTNAGAVNFIGNSPATTTVNNYIARVDHVFSDRNRIMGRFMGQPNELKFGSVFPTPGTDPFGYLTHEYYYNFGGTWTHTFSPTMFNDLRGNFSQRQRLSLSDSSDTALGAQIGLKGVPKQYFPSVVVTGYAGLGDGPGAPNSNGQYRTQSPVGAHLLADTVTKLAGKHQIKFGGEYRYGSSVDILTRTAGGAVTFNNQATGHSVAALLMGWVNTGGVEASELLSSRLDTYAGFFQDDWRITPSLTLSLGVRYDLDSPRRDQNNRQNSFDTQAINPVSKTPGIITFAGINGQSRYANQWDSNNFGPRVGFAWKVRNNWVVRGGAATLYNASLGLGNTAVLFTGFNTQGSFNSSNNGRTPAFILNDGFPALTYASTASLTPAYGAVAVGQAPTTAVTFLKPDRTTGYLHQVSLNIQHQLSNSLVMEVGYLGSFGRSLSGGPVLDLNQVPTNLLAAGNLQSLRPFPQFGNVQMLGADIGRSNFNGVNVGFEKRLTRGVQFNLNYTYSKFLDSLSGNDLGGGASYTNVYNLANAWGRSGNDIRHRLIVNSLYELPIGAGKPLNFNSRVLNGIFGGWSINGIGEFHTGTPLSPTQLTNSTNSYSTGVRPNVVGDPDLPGDRPRADKLLKWFNTAAFAAPANFTFGNAGRTFGNGPNLFSMDGSLLKTFTAERFSVQFRAEVLNLTNHANFANPNAQQGSPAFGQITSLVAGNQARIVQLGLYFKF